MVDILDLSSLASGTTNVSITVDREAGFDNTVDFYEVDADGNVVDADGNAIAPGEAGYAEIAIAGRLGLNLSTENGVTSLFNAEFSGGAFYAPLIAVETDFEAFADEDTSNDPIVYFSNAAANIDGFDHVTSAGNIFSFEDLPNGGDEDFNDIVLNLEAFVVEEPVVEEPVVEEPVVEEPVVEEPVVEEPVVEEPVVEEPVVEEPVVEEPVVEEPVVEEPVVEEPVVEEPVVEEPVVEEPVVELIGDGSITGLKFNDLNGNGFQDSELVQGADPDVVFIIDVSTSTTRGSFQGTPVGDVNADRGDNDILDAEIQGFIDLNQQLINQGLGNIDIGVVTLSTSSQTIITTTPNTDNDGNGTLDVVDALLPLRAGGSTSYSDALATAEEVFLNLGTEAGNGNLVFLSDGRPNRSDVFDDEVARLNDSGVNLSAFGVGEIEDEFLANLQVIDPDAQIFTSTDQLLNVFGDLNSDADGDGVVDGGGSQSTLEPTISGVTIYLDLDNNGVLDSGEPSQITDANGEYVFDGLTPGNYIVREVVPDGFTQTTDAFIEVSLGEGETVPDVDFGNTEDAALLGMEAVEI